MSNGKFSQTSSIESQRVHELLLLCEDQQLTRDPSQGTTYSGSRLSLQFLLCTVRFWIPGLNVWLSSPWSAVAFSVFSLRGAMLQHWRQMLLRILNNDDSKFDARRIVFRYGKRVREHWPSGNLVFNSRLWLGTLVVLPINPKIKTRSIPQICNGNAQSNDRFNRSGYLLSRYAIKPSCTLNLHNDLPSGKYMH